MNEELSKFERSVLERMVSRDSASSILRAQFEQLKVRKRWYSGAGLVTYFTIPEGVARVDAARKTFPDRPDFTLEHPNLKIGAMAIGFLSDGVMDHLECVTYQGDWPGDETLFRISDATVHVG